MACGCQGTTGQYEIVTAEGTVPAQVGPWPNDFTTQAAAQAALVSQGVGGFVRRRLQAARV